jgi:hypothetical protein
MEPKKTFDDCVGEIERQGQPTRGPRSRSGCTRAAAKDSRIWPDRIGTGVAFAISGARSEQLSVGANIDIELLVAAILASVEVAVVAGRRSVASHRMDVTLY